MTAAPEFATYVPPPPPEAGDKYKPIEHLGRTLIVMVNEFKPSIVTPNSPNGGPGVIVDLVDLDDPAEPTIYRDVLWMSGAIVDGLRTHAGSRKPVLIVFRSQVGKSGRAYPLADPVGEAGQERAAKFYAAHGDPFAATFASPTPADDDAEPPF